MNRKTYRGLIPFSGGIDSTAVLYQALTSFPDDNFLVFKVNLISSTSASRIVREAAAVNEIFEKLKAKGIENFDFISMKFDYSVFSPPPVWDSEVINYAAALCILNHPEIKEFWEGAIADDFKDPTFEKRLEKISKILYLVSERSPKNLDIIFSIKDKNKYEVMKLIPSDILPLTWSCRYPEGGPNWTLKRCHKCPACKTIGEVLHSHPGEFLELEIW